MKGRAAKAKLAGLAEYVPRAELGGLGIAFRGSVHGMRFAKTGKGVHSDCEVCSIDDAVTATPANSAHGADPASFAVVWLKR